MFSLDAAKAAIGAQIDPYTQMPWGERSVSLSGSAEALEVTLTVGYPTDDMITSPLRPVIQAAVSSLNGQVKTLTVISSIRAHAIQTGVSGHPNIRNVIAVGSGKGGVGKSTVAVNLAVSLSRLGATVGLLDADIYGPNIPRMLGVDSEAAALAHSDSGFVPVVRHGLHSMSMGYLVADEKPMVWRGPMVSGALLQLMNETAWPSLDYLIIDLPPGTGDVQLTLAKKIPVTAAVVVTTPQAVALHDVTKGIAMFEKVGVTVAGLIENMSGFVCPHCQSESDIFSSGGGQKLAESLTLPWLGRIPLSADIREGGDEGCPIALGAGPISTCYRTIAVHVAAKIASLGRDYSRHFSNVQVARD